jgi:hypothetical protein
VAAKAGTTVLARWSSTCDSCTAGTNDPLVGFRIGASGQRIVGISVAPQYPEYGSDNFRGDFYRLWGNALRWAAAGGPGPSAARSANPAVWPARVATAPTGGVRGGSAVRRAVR